MADDYRACADDLKQALSSNKEINMSDKSVKEIWEALRPVLTDEQMAQLMYVKALRLEEELKGKKHEQNI